MKDRCKHGPLDNQCSLCAGMPSRVKYREDRGDGPAWLVSEYHAAIRVRAALNDGFRQHKYTLDRDH